MMLIGFRRVRYSLCKITITKALLQSPIFQLHLVRAPSGKLEKEQDEAEKKEVSQVEVTIYI